MCRILRKKWFMCAEFWRICNLMQTEFEFSYSRKLWALIIIVPSSDDFLELRQLMCVCVFVHTLIYKLVCALHQMLSGDISLSVMLSIFGSLILSLRQVHINNGRQQLHTLKFRCMKLCNYMWILCFAFADIYSWQICGIYPRLMEKPASDWTSFVGGRQRCDHPLVDWLILLHMEVMP